MTRDDIIRMAQAAGFETGVAGLGVPNQYLTDGPVDAPWLFDAVERFAELVAAAECERCAKVCEELVGVAEKINGEDAASCFADAVREREGL